MVECTPIKVLQLFCWPMTPLIINLPYDHPHLSGSRQFAYKNFGCQQINKITAWLLHASSFMYMGNILREKEYNIGYIYNFRPASTVLLTKWSASIIWEASYTYVYIQNHDIL